MQTASRMECDRRTESILMSVFSHHQTLAAVFLTLLIINCIVAPAHAASRSATPPDPDNAATYYNQAAKFLQGKLTFEEQSLLADYVATPGRPPSQEVLSALHKIQPALDLARQAARAGYSNFGLDYSQGLNLSLSHLASVRQLARYLMADNNAKIASGDNVNAAKDIAAMYHLAGNLGDDRVVISSLVGQAIIMAADQNINTISGSGQLDPDTASILLSAIQSCDANDPAQIVNAVMMEGTLISGTFQKYVDEMRAGQNVDLNSYFNELYANDPTNTYRDTFKGMSADQIQHQIDGYRKLMDAYANAFSMTDTKAAQAEIDRLEEATAAGKYGQLAPIVLPALGRIYQTYLKTRMTLDDRMTMLRNLAQGRIKSDDLRNAAMWYLRAIHTINTTLDPTVIADIDTFDPTHPDLPFESGGVGAGHPAAAASPPVDFERLLGPIVQTLTEGSKIRLCDFTMGAGAKMPRRRELMLPDYVQGLHQCVNVMLLEAHRLVREGQSDQALDTLAAAMRMIRHFSGEGLLLTSAVSQSGWNDLMSLTRLDLDAIEAKASPTAYRAPWFASRQMNQRDPFGYRRAGALIRDNLPERFAQDFPDESMKAAVKANLLKTITNSDADALLDLLLYFRCTTWKGQLSDPPPDKYFDPKKELHDRSAHLPSPLSNLPDLANLSLATQPLFIRYITWSTAPSSLTHQGGTPTSTTPSTPPQKSGPTTNGAIASAGSSQPDPQSFSLPPLLTLDESRRSARADLDAGIALFDALARKHPVPHETKPQSAESDNHATGNTAAQKDH